MALGDGLSGEGSICGDHSVLKREGKTWGAEWLPRKTTEVKARGPDTGFQRKDWTQPKARAWFLLGTSLVLCLVVVLFPLTVDKFHSQPFSLPPFLSMLLLKLSWVWSYSVWLCPWVPEMSCHPLSGLACWPPACGCQRATERTHTGTSHLVPLLPRL